MLELFLVLLSYCFRILRSWCSWGAVSRFSLPATFWNQLPTPLVYISVHTTQMLFWRVTEKYSVAAFEPGQGFIAGDTSFSVTLDPVIQDDAIEIEEHIKRHLNWKNKNSTPFISAYLDFHMAKIEALRRMKDGKESVVLWKIRLYVGNEIEWVTINGLKRNLGFWISENAFHNARYGAVFVHEIPRDYVVGGERYTNRKGRKWLLSTHESPTDVTNFFFQTEWAGGKWLSNYHSYYWMMWEVNRDNHHLSPDGFREGRVRMRTDYCDGRRNEAK